MPQTHFQFDGLQNAFRLPAEKPAALTIQDRFNSWIERNPLIETEYIRRALAALDAGATRLFSQAIVSDMRRDPTLSSQGDKYKISDHWTRYLALRAMEREPRLRGMFKTK